MEFSFDLTVAWACILAIGIMAYVIMDGFDLGVGLLFPFLKSRHERDVTMNSVAPVWDGNETWLVLGGGGLFAAFPLAFAILMPALYAPIIAMLLGLVFRGVAFEYRWRTIKYQWAWDSAFAGGSFIAAMAQGMALGAILQGVDVSGRAYGGGWWDWLTPFTVITGLSVVAGYALLGATWLVMKTTGDLRDRARGYAKDLLLLVLVCLVTVSAVTPFLNVNYWQRWFTLPSVLVAAQIPLLVTVTAAALWRSLNKGRDYRPFLLTLALFGLSFLGLGVSMFPYVVPSADPAQAVTIWQAAAPAKSQLFMLVGAAVLLPVIIGYTAYAYWVFRGKTEDHHGYH